SSSSMFVFSSIVRRLPTSPLFPYTTLFRSDLEADPVPAQARAPLERPSRGRGDAEPGAATEVTFDASGRILRDNVYGTVDEDVRSEEHTSELQSRVDLVCRLLLEKKKKTTT